jgi:hypothetical protein
MKKAAPSPTRWAIDISHVLNAALGPEHFPINIAEVAREYSAKRFPDDPVSLVKGAALPGFEGALVRAPEGKKGWGILYNDGITSEGRINFTLAHEFGHYLLHRYAHPNGFRCGERDVVRWDSPYGQLENEANVFAANILMPLDDYRKQVAANVRVDLDMISHCAERYRVSLIAATLRWLSYTDMRAVLVVSRDGFIDWARSSERALKTRAFFRTSQGPIEIPARSLVARQNLIVDNRNGEMLPAGVWFPHEEVREMTVFSEQYRFAISLLLLGNDPVFHASEELEQDAYERMTGLNRR